MKLKYFQVKGKWYSCDNMFHFMATDKDGNVGIFTKRPFEYVEQGFWDNPPVSNGFMATVPLPIEDRTPCHRWLQSLRSLNDNKYGIH